MICVSLGLDSVSGCLKALEDIEFAEIRLDLMDVRPADIPALFSAGRRLIATCRPPKAISSASQARAMPPSPIRRRMRYFLRIVLLSVIGMWEPTYVV